MEGGLRRRIAAVKGGERQIVLDNGGLAGGTTRQHVLKAETAAEGLHLAHVDAANFTGADGRLRAAEALSLTRLSHDRLVSTSLRPGGRIALPPWRSAAPFLIGGATSRPDLLAKGLGEETLTPEEAAHRLAEEAAAQGLAPILLFDGSRAAAAALARAEPALRLVTYRSTAHPPQSLEKVGDCALATPGERGKSVIRLIWRGDSFAAASVQSLGPEVPDDPEAERIFRRYLARVSKEGLLEKVARTPAKGFSGSTKCGSCHAQSAKVWSSSAHAHALKTLEHEGHDRDPDCVSCHVTGLTKTTGFRSRASTPALANVGCESCHGPGADHSKSPKVFKMAKVGAKACVPCHTPENSPKFDFSIYWDKIRHNR